MKLIRLALVLTLSVISYMSCQQKKSPTKFKEDTFWDKYIIQIPVEAKKVVDGKWMTEKGYKDIFALEIIKGNHADTSLSNLLNEIIEKNQSDTYKGKTIVRKDTININGFKGIFADYQKNSNNVVFKVMTYFSFIVLKGNDETILINTLSLGKNYTEDVKAIVRSIALKTF